MKWGIGLVIAALLYIPTYSHAGTPLFNPAAPVPGKQTVWVPAGAMTTTTTAGAPALAAVETTAGRPDLQVVDFDASSDEHLQFSITFPKNWDESTITFKLYWTSTATDTDGIAFGLQCNAVSDNVTIDAAFGTAVVVTDDAQSAAEELYISAESGAITVGGTPAEGDLTFCDLYRDISDANDDMAEDARVLGIRILYTTNANNDD